MVKTEKQDVAEIHLAAWSHVLYLSILPVMTEDARTPAATDNSDISLIMKAERIIFLVSVLLAQNVDSYFLVVWDARAKYSVLLLGLGALHGWGGLN